VKILKVQYWYTYEKDGMHLCDYDHCHCKWITYGYFSTDYDIKKLILKIMNDRQDWDMGNISVTEITLDKLPVEKKEISDRYLEEKNGK
jgi:hypothetical protein|tara:strand:- start:409 stop:675 length:267 start_codon:yes stop_codon:yes gene_type:complete